MLMTVHSFSTQYNTEQFWQSALLLPDKRHSSDIVYPRREGHSIRTFTSSKSTQQQLNVYFSLVFLFLWQRKKNSQQLLHNVKLFTCETKIHTNNNLNTRIWHKMCKNSTHSLCSREKHCNSYSAELVGLTFWSPIMFSTMKSWCKSFVCSGRLKHKHNTMPSAQFLERCNRIQEWHCGSGHRAVMFCVWIGGIIGM